MADLILKVPVTLKVSIILKRFLHDHKELDETILEPHL